MVDKVHVVCNIYARMTQAEDFLVQQYILLAKPCYPVGIHAFLHNFDDSHELIAVDFFEKSINLIIVLDKASVLAIFVLKF